MDVAAENRLRPVLLDKAKQPTAPRLVEIVVGAALIAIGHIRRIVNADEGAHLRRLRQLEFEPLGLLLLGGQARIDERCIEREESAAIQFETVVIRPEVLAVSRDAL